MPLPCNVCKSPDSVMWGVCHNPRSEPCVAKRELALARGSEKMLPSHEKKLKQENTDLRAALAEAQEMKKELTAERDFARDALRFARGYKGIEARACPLCTYINGVFIKYCRMHEDMDLFKAERDALAAKLKIAEEALVMARRLLREKDGSHKKARPKCLK